MNNRKQIIYSLINCLYHPPLNPLPSREGKRREKLSSPRPLWEGIKGRGIYPLEIRKNLINNIQSLWMKAGKEKTIMAHGTSMQPFIQDGDLITFKPLIQGEHIRIGDIAVFTGHSSLIAHRIIDRVQINGKTWFKEKGDNNYYSTVIPDDVILGKVAAIYDESKILKVLLYSRYWTIANSLLGFYWKVLFSLIEVVVEIKKRSFYLRKIHFFSEWNKKIIRFLVRLPVTVMSQR
jgi:signal peptidase I